MFRWVCFWVLFGEILKIQKTQKTSKKKQEIIKKNKKYSNPLEPAQNRGFVYFLIIFWSFWFIFWISFWFFSRFVAFFGFWGSPQTRPRNRPSGTPRGESAKPRIWFFLIFSIFLDYFLFFFEFSIWFFFFWFVCVFLIFYFSSNIGSYGIVTVHKTRRAWSKRGHDLKKQSSRLEKIVQRAPLRSL